MGNVDENDWSGASSDFWNRSVDFFLHDYIPTISFHFYLKNKDISEYKEKLSDIKDIESCFIKAPLIERDYEVSAKIVD